MCPNSKPLFVPIYQFQQDLSSGQYSSGIALSASHGGMGVTNVSEIPSQVTQSVFEL